MSTIFSRHRTSYLLTIVVFTLFLLTACQSTPVCWQLMETTITRDTSRAPGMISESRLTKARSLLATNEDCMSEVRRLSEKAEGRATYRCEPVKCGF